MLGASAVDWAMGITNGVGGVPLGRELGFPQSPVDGGPGLVRSLPTSCGDGSGEASAEAMCAAPSVVRASRLLTGFIRSTLKRGLVKKSPFPNTKFP